jgi:hypothetical protein
MKKNRDFHFHIQPESVCTWTTVMRFSVSVPVLSEQMFVAPPIVSHASKCLTKFLSFNISCIEYLKVKYLHQISNQTKKQFKRKFKFEKSKKMKW